MIKDILDFDNGAAMQAHAAIVGSGIAGIEAARRLAAAGLSVIVLESGRRQFDPAIDALNDIRHVGKPHRQYTPESDYHDYLPEQYQGKNRIRQFGGTANAWTGKWRAFTQGDLASRPWIPHSQWPIDLEELETLYAQIAADYGLGDVVQEAASPAFAAEQASLAGAGLKLAVHYWQKQTTRVPETFGEELARSAEINVILGATVTELVLDDTLQHVCALECRSLEGRRITVRADQVILATGGLEAPRVLLASNRQIAQGIGNAHDVVGRYYLEHPKQQTGRMRPGPRLSEFASRLQSQPRPRLCVSFSLSDDMIERHQLLRHSVYVSPRYERITDRARRWLSSKAAFRDGIGAIGHYRVKFATEQAPNRDSRVYLGTRRDAMGMPEMVVDWRFTDLDHRSIGLACRELKRAFAETGLGDLQFGADPMTIDATMDAAHPMGTTRMSDDPKSGVVDRNCLVFGTHNLYVASSSVFPTGAVYSPTYTIVALARRASDHAAAEHAKAKAPIEIAG